MKKRVSIMISFDVDGCIMYLDPENRGLVTTEWHCRISAQRDKNNKQKSLHSIFLVLDLDIGRNCRRWIRHPV